jgi:hypothetical protein
MVSTEGRIATSGQLNKPNVEIMSAKQEQRIQRIQVLSKEPRPLTAHRKHVRAEGTLLIVLLLLTATGVAQPLIPAAPGVTGPRIQFATPVHDFGRMKNGETHKYSYVFTNIGDRLLEISNVQASCGCTTSGAYSRQVEPGKTGSIPIQFSSGNFQGDVTKMITVMCNDTTQPIVSLQLKAHVWKPIETIPQLATLQVTAESPSSTTTVRIVNHEETPLVLSEPQSSNPAFAAELRTRQPGKEFELVVRTVPPLAIGMVQGQISLKTSSTNLPVVHIAAWANVQPAVTVMPAQIILPVNPLAAPRPYTISIRNNTTNALVLTDPAVNAGNVNVQLKEFQPGRYFSLTVTFPAGFEIAPGDAVELSLKSNHPQFPVIKVPVQHPPRPTPTAASGRVLSPVTPPSVPR